MPIYLDVLLAVNGFINYLLLLSTMKILHFKSGRLRLLFGAIWGSIFSLKIFLPEFNFLIELLLRFFFAATIVLISFKFSSTKAFLKGFAAFFSVNFALSGVIICLIYLFNPPDLLYNNGVIYYNLSFILLIALSTAAFFIITMLEKFLSRKTQGQKIYDVVICKDNKKATGRGLLDTGNSLKDPFSGDGVIVADVKSVKEFLPNGFLDYLNGEAVSGLRLIPVSTVCSTGLLPAFKPDLVEINGITKKITIKNVYIAVSKERFCHGEFEFLLYNSILEENKNEKNHRAFKQID